MSLSLAIVSYGKMGRLIEQLAPQYGFDVRAKFGGRDNPRGQALSYVTLRAPSRIPLAQNGDSHFKLLSL
jgi:hypothetical protein